MTTVYENLINDLKIKLKNKNIKFRDIFNLLNNEKYDEIINLFNEKNDEIINSANDDTISILIQNIVLERQIIGDSVETKLNNLLWLNDRLIQFNEEPQTTITKAQKLLKKNVVINIYDLEAEKYERTTIQLLKKELRKKPERRYPLCIAKENITLGCFLKKI